MRQRLCACWGVLWLAVWFFLGASAIQAQETAAPGGDSAAYPCEETADRLLETSPEQRPDLADDYLKAGCRPLLPAIERALKEGEWPDGADLGPTDRQSLLVRATSAAYAEAETLTVSLLEGGVWPDGTSLTFEGGGQLVRSLKPVLTPYRVRLLLDVYEQLDVPHIRQAVLQTLRGSNVPEAIIPALHAHYEEVGSVLEAARAALGDEAEASPAAVHARLIRELPPGPILDWARALAEKHPGEEVTAALKDRGLLR